MHAFLAKDRIPRTARKEVFERLAQLDDRHLRGVLRDFQHPREMITLDRVQLTPKRHLRGLGQAVVLLPRLVLALPLGQRPVVGEPRRAGGSGKVACALLGLSAIL